MAELVHDLFDGEAIRDTNTHTSSAVDHRGYATKSIIVENDLNESVTIQLQTARDLAFTKPCNAGNSFVVSANSCQLETSDSYLPFIRFTAICSTAPTTGDLTVEVLGVE